MHTKLTYYFLRLTNNLVEKICNEFDVRGFLREFAFDLLTHRAFMVIVFFPRCKFSPDKRSIVISWKRKWRFSYDPRRYLKILSIRFVCHCPQRLALEDPILIYFVKTASDLIDNVNELNRLPIQVILLKKTPVVCDVM